MALRATDLYEPRPRPQPELQLVPPPPRRHGVAASAFVLLLCGLLSIPVVSAALEDPPAVPHEERREVAAGSIGELDRFPGVPKRALPRSPEHFAGIAFVRCTGLWVGEPDGANARKILPMSGISAPTFSGDGRSIAFVRTNGAQQSLWVAGADGTDPRELGTVTSAEAPIAQRVTGLAWAPKEDTIAFALVDATYGPLTGGSAIWTHDISSGRFERVTSGWPAPAWWGDRLFAGSYDGAPDLQLATTATEKTVRSVNSGFDDFAAAFVPRGWWNGTNNEMVILRSTKNGLRLAFRNGWRESDRFVAKAPAGYRFARFAQPAITQDGARVVIDLLDPGAGRDLGILDPETGEWDVLDYAWDPSASPVPTIVGPLSQGDARIAAEMLLNTMERQPDRAEMLTEGRTLPAAREWHWFGWALQDPRRSDGRWVVPGVAYSSGRRGAPYEYRTFDIIVGRTGGRLTATPVDLGAVTPVTTLADAHAFAEAATGMSLPALPPLPPGTSLARNYALSAYSYGGKTQATINMNVPTTKNGRARDMSFSFGEDIDFSMGCGGAMDPEPVEVAGQPGMADHMEGFNQVIWPATPEDPSGPLSISGSVSREEILGYAEQMGAP